MQVSPLPLLKSTLLAMLTFKRSNADGLARGLVVKAIRLVVGKSRFNSLAGSDQKTKTWY